jgi:hypothetical protein
MLKIHQQPVSGPLLLGTTAAVLLLLLFFIVVDQPENVCLAQGKPDLAGQKARLAAAEQKVINIEEEKSLFNFHYFFVVFGFGL